MAGAAALTAIAGPAHAADYTPTPYPSTPLPTAEELHTLKRFTYGYTPAALRALRAAGGPQAWFLQQLNPALVTEAPEADIEDWWVSITASPETIVERDRSEVERAWRAVQNYSSYVTLKHIYSHRQVLHLMAEFWEDHFYIPKDDDGVFPFRIQFGHKMRDLALTSFEELLLASTTHPAMGVSLDNANSKKQAVNENLGRELLELHTVGQGQYSEDDVKASARILTGYRIDMWRTWAVTYDPAWHYVGAVKVMDFTHANSAPDGRPVVEAYLKYLAHHPATARRVVRKLAQRFVEDSPSEALVEDLAQVYLANGTQIKPVLEALFAAPAFWASANRKVRTPTDELAAIYRALGTKFARPTAEDSGANSFIWAASGLGAMPFSWPRPDGPPRTAAAWINPSRFLGSWDIHWGAAGGWWPSKETTWVAHSARLPQASISLSQLVDHLSRSFLGQASTPALVQAVSEATGYAPTTTITKDHGIVRWQMPYLLALVLNHPVFYLR